MIFQLRPILGIYKSLTDTRIGSKESSACRAGPVRQTRLYVPARQATGWQNRFLGIDSWTLLKVYKFRLSGDSRTPGILETGLLKKFTKLGSAGALELYELENRESYYRLSTTV
jgi:hypothetical protein